MDSLLLVVVVVGIVLAVAIGTAARRRRRRVAHLRVAQYGMEAQLSRLTQKAIQQMLLQSRLTEGVSDHQRRPSTKQADVIEGEAWDA